MGETRDINGELLKLRREERGWAQSDMATHACLSIKQIRQLEEGGISAFYGESVKLAAAKKVAGLLGVPLDELWVVPQALQESAPETGQSHADAVDEVVIGSAEQPEPSLNEGHHEDVNKFSENSSISTASQEAKPKTSLWLIVGLFVSALAIAAYMRPESESVVTETPPPLQVVPAQVAESASSASGMVDAAPASASEAVVPKLGASSVAPMSAPIAS